MPDKPVTVRLPQSLLNQLMGLSIVDGNSLAEQIRAGMTKYVEERRNAPDFHEQLERARARRDDALSALTGK